MTSSIARVVGAYAIFASLWILLSDRALGALFPDHASYAVYGTLKGVVFVAVTAALLWGLLRVELGRRARAELALAETTAQLQRAQRIAHVGHWVWAADGSRIEGSGQLLEIFGLDPATSALTGARLLAAIHPDDCQLLDDLRCRLRAGEPTWPVECRVLRSDGSVRTIWVEVGDVRRDDAGALTAVSGVVQDITERKLLELQVLRSQRTEAVGALASGIAHDLNNVLTPVLVMAPLLRESLTSPEDRSLIDTLEQCARRGADIIRQLLTFARGAPGARVALPLRHLVREMAKIAQETFPRDIDIRAEIASDLWTVQGDITQMHQVLMNLCINARDAMPHGGRLTLRAANVALDGSELPDVPPRVGRHVCLAVIDTGEGIAEADRERIFDPFFTTKEPGKGTGLGLSTVLGIVRGHGGAIAVESQRGGGSTFAVYLPASTLDSAADDDPDDEVPAGDGSAILLVEDELAVRHGLVRALASAGYAVVEASNGQEGLEAWQRHGDVIRVIVTDLVMPVMGGAAMVARLRAQAVSVPILALTGLGSSPDDPLPDGVSASLSKPCTPDQLLRAVGALLPSRESAPGSGGAEVLEPR
ncbi:PAS domain-containing sensor histidine kinase [Luteitalea sp. TBR-22]|uniref:hybrid sensor histidine kinase/response regulator n=1 Tax=Luteitalea sp. TBR-22 TaxID=2802971 RepID=UPI001EF5CDB7|nr:PAS domain-containing sensor histidine kinase [Luteitalea sp. TBR-22]